MTTATTKPDIPEDNLPRFAADGFTDHTFTSPTSGAQLSVRVWPAIRSDPSSPTKPAPFVSCTHGGGFLAGHHYATMTWTEVGFRRQKGYHLVAHNYRLGPQVSIKEQIQDCLDCVAWSRENLPRILGEEQVDVDRYVLAGESAGGFFVTMMATKLIEAFGKGSGVPPPRAVVDIYGVVNWFTMPVSLDVHPEQIEGTEWKGRWTEKELRTYLGDRDPENILLDSFFWDEDLLVTEEDLKKRLKTTELKYTERRLLQGELHRWRSERGTLEDINRGVFHSEKWGVERGTKEYERMAFEYKKSVSAELLAVEAAIRGDKYPPTAFLHGSGDAAVPIDQSESFARTLRGLGVPVVECYEEGEPHVFDRKYTDPDVPGWDKYIQPILDFVEEHVNKD